MTHRRARILVWFVLLPITIAKLMQAGVQKPKRAEALDLGQTRRAVLFLLGRREPAEPFRRTDRPGDHEGEGVHYVPDACAKTCLRSPRARSATPSAAGAEQKHAEPMLGGLRRTDPLVDRIGPAELGL